MLTYLELLVKMALPFLPRLYYMCDIACCYIGWPWLAMTWVNEVTQICYMFLSSSWVCFHRWVTDTRERAKTYKASQELSSELTCHHLHHILLAEACHRPTHKNDEKHILLFTERNFKVNGKGCRHKRGNVGEKLGLLIDSIY